MDPYRDFAGDKDLEIAEEPDDVPPNDFAGNVMQAKVTNTESRSYGKGKFKNSFETQNGIKISQVGKLREDKVFVVMGSYSYTGADGRRYKVKYTADEFGYHPITELDLDIPELDLEKGGKVGKTASIGNRFGSNFGGRGNSVTKPTTTTTRRPTTKNFEFTYGKATQPPVASLGKGYLPPNNAYLPPSNGYLPPPNGYLPPKRSSFAPVGVQPPLKV